MLGTAAFLAGYQAQNCPIYGAERRGAAVASITRIGDGPILQRGPIDQPDVIVVGDETLLKNPAAGVLLGQASASVVLINAESTDSPRRRYAIEPPCLACDVTGHTLKALGRASALISPLAAAAARLVRCIALPPLIDAVLQALDHLEVPAETIDKNVVLAESVFAVLREVKIRRAKTNGSMDLHHVGYDGPTRGSPTIASPRNAILRDTGSWRVERPVVDGSLCTCCRLCLVACLDGAISLDEEGYPVVDYDHCKGCMICQRVCPVHAVSREREVRVW